MKRAGSKARAKKVGERKHCSHCGSELIQEETPSASDMRTETSELDSRVGADSSKSVPIMDSKAILEIQNAVLGPFTVWLNIVKFLLAGITAMCLVLGFLAAFFGLEARNIPEKLEALKQQAVQIETEERHLKSHLDSVEKRAKEAENYIQASRRYLQDLTQRIEFASNDETNRVKAEIEGTIRAHREYLESIDVRPKLSVIGVEVHSDYDKAPHYDPSCNRICLSPLCARDADIICEFYTAHLFYCTLSGMPEIRSGVALYFTCSRKNDSHYAETYSRLCSSPVEDRWLEKRNIDNQIKFADLGKDAVPIDFGEVWAAIFWEIRKLIGPEEADRLIASTVNGYAPRSTDEDLSQAQLRFIRDLLRRVKIIDQGLEQKVRDTFFHRGLEVSR